MARFAKPLLLDDDHPLLLYRNKGVWTHKTSKTTRVHRQKSHQVKKKKNTKTHTKKKNVDFPGLPTLPSVNRPSSKTCNNRFNTWDSAESLTEPTHRMKGSLSRGHLFLFTLLSQNFCKNHNCTLYWLFIRDTYNDLS